jgi:hypothetical protein
VIGLPILALAQQYTPMGHGKASKFTLFLLAKVVVLAFASTNKEYCELICRLLDTCAMPETHMIHVQKNISFGECRIWMRSTIWTVDISQAYSDHEFNKSVGRKYNKQQLWSWDTQSNLVRRRNRTSCDHAVQN